MTSLQIALSACGLMPDGIPVEGVGDGDNLLPQLRRAWLRHPAPSIWGRWVALQKPPMELTWSLPAPTLLNPERWFGLRLVWWPHGIPARPWTAIVASRLSSSTPAADAVFAALRVHCIGLPPGQQLLQIHGPTVSQFTDHLIQTCGVPAVRCEVPTNRLSLRGWMRRVVRSAVCSDPDGAAAVWVSPLVAGDLEGREHAAHPLTDRLQIGLADRIVVLGIREGGHLESLLRLRARDNRDPASVVEVPDCVTSTALHALETSPLTLTRRTVWSMSEQRLLSEPQTQDASLSEKRRCATADTVDSPQVRRGRGDMLAEMDSQRRAELLPVTRYLLHWTRASDAPWPDQTVSEYLDDVLWSAPSPSVDCGRAVEGWRSDMSLRDGTALATLARICRQQRLLASSRAIRGGHAVVCFSARTIGELHQLRQFRPHRRRWDFEPFGIAIALTWLVQRGARPVIYGNETTWNNLPPVQRPFFQKLSRPERHGAQGRRTRRAPDQDWRSEREWRIAADVDLSSLTARQAFVFVPADVDPGLLNDVCRWPMIRLRP